MEPQFIANNYQESFQFLQARKKRQVNQLILLNNLQKGEQNISSTLLLTLFNRVLSSLYDDKLQIKFLPSQGINQDQINAYNILAQSDYLEMGKAKLDYDWIWDTLFFGRGYLETLRFNKKRKIMEPHVINPLAFGYDPYFSDPQQWRYYWKWLSKSKHELQKLISKGVITGVKDVKEIPAGFDEYFWEYKTRRDTAREGVQPPKDTPNGDVYQILEYYGYDEDGDKCVYWTDRDCAKILMHEKLDLGEGEDGEMKWPIIVKEAFREPHSSIPFSISDLLDDKHRAESVLLNLAFIAAKDMANPMYWYNENVTDPAQFLARQLNQHIPLEGNATGDTSVGVINKNNPMSPEMLNFMTYLRSQATDPVGVGISVKPETGNSNNTATEAAIDQQLNEMATSLQSKVLQFGEQEFWAHWFNHYAKEGEALGSKMANIVGVKGVDSKEIDLGVFHTDYPPGVLVYSAKEAEYKELVLRRDLMQLYPALVQTLDPDGIRNFNKHVFFPKFLQDPSLIDVMLPKTIDELKAEEENEQLKVDSLPEALPTDNHTTHIYTHHMVQPKTWATWLHIMEHEEMLAEQKAQEQMMVQQEMMGGSLGGAGKVGTEKKSPMSQASPLKTEITSNNLQK